MKPVKFKHQNVVYAENQPEYMPLPALKIEGNEGIVVSCWKLSFKEKVMVLFSGRVWLSLWSFNQALTPSLLSVDRKEIYTHPDDSKSRWKKFFWHEKP